MSFPGFYLSRVWLGSKVSAKLLPSTIRPLAAHVKLTENCQAKCISCDYWKSRWEDEIDTERAVELLNEIGSAGIRSLRFTGGEPLLRKDLFHILKTANTSPFKTIILQTNGLLIKKLHEEINASPITKVCVSIDGLKAANDFIRGIKGYFDLGMEGIRLLRNKQVAIAVTLNKISAAELGRLAEVAHGVGADLQFNVLSRNIYFLKDADNDAMWPERGDVTAISKFLRDVLKRPAYEVDYIAKYYNNEATEEPPCVLGYTQVFVLSNGDVMTGCYPLKPVGNILRDRFETILASDAYARQCVAMVRRECPGCTCGIETSLAMQHATSSAFFELSRLKLRPKNDRVFPIGAPVEGAQNT
ncbi:MAG TPA: radical SAM protein [Candidatus Acidoferrales bacterium]|nr:radical SAM protein [Candidatus Acidoferrales bacterium]